MLHAKVEPNPPAGTQNTDLNFPENHASILYSPGYIPKEQDQEYYYPVQDNFTGMASFNVDVREHEAQVLDKPPPLVDDHDLKPIKGKALHTVDTLRSSKYGRQRMRQEPMFGKAPIMEDGCKEPDLPDMESVHQITMWREVFLKAKCDKETSPHFVIVTNVDQPRTSGAGDRRLRVLRDTGATSSLFPTHVAQQEGWDIRPAPGVTLTTANG